MAIDLRSDTVTRPDAGMRQAMVQAEVGDDVLGDDPTVQALQERIARLLAKNAALFTPSGTMANQLALRSQTSPGDEVLLDRNAHILNYESGAGAALSGIQFRTLDSPAGGFTSEDLRALRRPDHFAFPHMVLVEMENTHNHRGGEIFDLERMRDVWRWARGEGLRVHLDGARLWNASAATGIPLADYAACADTVSVCFSKGLGAPVGSALVGDADTIRRAHRLRKMLGGGMRQAGILAAAALYALDHNLRRLEDDHRKARTLADAIERCSRLRLARPVETNILIVELTDPDDTPAKLVEDLRRRQILASVWEERTIRLVTHLDSSSADVEHTAGQLVELRG
ncbi:MAG: low-specificity L-threonine aldolase [Candidatus Krumholzibacteriia bacterium]